MRSHKRSLQGAFFRGFLRLERLLRPQSADEPRTVLVLAYMPALGYCIHMTPVYEALKRISLTVVVATHGVNLQVLRHSPFVDRLLETPNPMHNLPGAVLSLRRQLRGLEPDCVLTGPADQRTRIGLLGALACAGWRGGYAVHPQLYQRPLRYDRSQSRLANNLRLAELLDCEMEGLSPKVFYSQQEERHAASLIPDGRRVLAVVPGSSGGLPTAWIDDRWAAVVRFAVAELGVEVVYVGAAQDSSRIGRIRELAGGLGRSLAGETTIGELAAMLARCSAVAAITTGAMHVARTVGVPVVVLGPAWEAPLEWMTPLEPWVTLLRGTDAARTEGYRMEEISVEMVTSALRKIMPENGLR